MENEWYIYKVTIRNQLTSLLPTMFFNVILLFIFIYLEFNLIAIFFTLLFFILIDTLPTILVHLNYLKHNGNLVLKINPKKKSLIYITTHDSFEYKFDDILLIEYIRSSTFHSGKFSFGQYRYCRFLFKDKKRLVITSLMIKNIDQIFEDLFGRKIECSGKKILCFIDEGD
ncbi:MAG: hypothetical protein KGO81_04840 [Bacteroidota bacterium]|nr:hypothetical protein [Bacteroidota bacterium]